jgi:hypothetical protein
VILEYLIDPSTNVSKQKISERRAMKVSTGKVSSPESSTDMSPKQWNTTLVSQKNEETSSSGKKGAPTYDTSYSKPNASSFIGMKDPSDDKPSFRDIRSVRNDDDAVDDDASDRTYSVGIILSLEEKEFLHHRLYRSRCR